MMSSDGASTSDAGSSRGMPAPRRESKRPKYSRFTQQELPACKPLLTPGWIISTFLVVGIIFIPIGAVTLHASNSVVEIVHRYESDCLPPSLSTKEQKVQFIQDNTTDKTCTVILTVPEKMNAPVYVYYQLDNFYQNHRRYVKSRNDKQLRSDSQSGTDISTSGCKPEATIGGRPIVPCGLIAWSLFNDTYTFATGGRGLPVNKRHISWKSDRQDKFGKIKPLNFQNDLNGTSNTSRIGGGYLDPNQSLDENEDLIVWMRTAALPTFRKLWGKIETDLVVNQTIRVTIGNNYNTYTFSGKKKLVLSTTSWLGGKNHFLGIAYLTVGILSIVLATLFFLIHLKYARPLGDPSYLSWNKRNAAVASSSSQ